MGAGSFLFSWVDMGERRAHNMIGFLRLHEVIFKGFDGRADRSGQGLPQAPLEEKGIRILRKREMNLFPPLTSLIL
jgi:hypothetical protein